MATVELKMHLKSFGLFGQQNLRTSDLNYFYILNRRMVLTSLMEGFNHIKLLKSL